MTIEPLPLPPRYNLDFEPVPHPEPGMATLDEICSLYLKWRLVEQKTLTCHTAVSEALMRSAATVRPDYLLGSPIESIFGIPIEIDDDMQPGTWKLKAGGREIDSGVI
jgi:hypothetical protein